MLTSGSFEQGEQPQPPKFSLSTVLRVFLTEIRSVFLERFVRVFDRIFLQHTRGFFLHSDGAAALQTGTLRCTLFIDPEALYKYVTKHFVFCLSLERDLPTRVLWVLITQKLKLKVVYLFMHLLCFICIYREHLMSFIVNLCM